MSPFGSLNWSGTILDLGVLLGRDTVFSHEALDECDAMRAFVSLWAQISIAVFVAICTPDACLLPPG